MRWPWSKEAKAARRLEREAWQALQDHIEATNPRCLCGHRRADHPLNGCTHRDYTFGGVWWCQCGAFKAKGDIGPEKG